MIDAKRYDDPQYQGLVQRLDEVLHGSELDDVIPALVMFTATAGVLGGVDKKVLLSFFADTLDKTYGAKRAR